MPKSSLGTVSHKPFGLGISQLLIGARQISSSFLRPKKEGDPPKQQTPDIHRHTHARTHIITVLCKVTMYMHICVCICICEVMSYELRKEEQKQQFFAAEQAGNPVSIRGVC